MAQSQSLSPMRVGDGSPMGHRAGGQSNYVISNNNGALIASDQKKSRQGGRSEYTMTPIKENVVHVKSHKSKS